MQQLVLTGTFLLTFQLPHFDTHRPQFLGLHWSVGSSVNGANFELVIVFLGVTYLKQLGSRIYFIMTW